jgi:hypothetical protein
MRDDASVSESLPCWKMRKSEQTEVALFALAYLALGLFLLIATYNAKIFGGFLVLLSPVGFYFFARRPCLCLVEGGLFVEVVPVLVELEVAVPRLMPASR